jgi:hypothetical protein
MSDEKARPARDEVTPESGPGALCPEAQADGVPCQELGKDCPTCEKAVPPPKRGEEGPG